MKIVFRAPGDLLASMKRDLRRPHPFALERVGWISVSAAMAADSLLLLAKEYHSVPEDHYAKTTAVGAMLNQEGIRAGLNLALTSQSGVFHVHVHDHAGVPRFSGTDTREQSKFVPDFFAVQRRVPHGAIVFSRDAAIGRAWLERAIVRPIDEFHSVGAPSWFGLKPRGRGLFA